MTVCGIKHRHLYSVEIDRIFKKYRHVKLKSSIFLVVLCGTLREKFVYFPNKSCNFRLHTHIFHLYFQTSLLKRNTLWCILTVSSKNLYTTRNTLWCILTVSSKKYSISDQNVRTLCPTSDQLNWFEKHPFYAGRQCGRAV